MLARVLSGGVSGIEGYMVKVEVDVAHGLPCFTTVGLGDSAVREGRDRVTSAIRNSGFRFPMDRVTVNLAPADVRKEGAGFDLPIAIGILAATGQIDTRMIQRAAVMGELSLDGTTRRVNGVLPMAAAAARDGIEAVIVPAANAPEALALDAVRVLAVRDLRGAVRVIGGGRGDPAPESVPVVGSVRGAASDISQVRGQSYVKRALEVAAAGGHNLLMVGPPGVGKTMLARCLPAILPDLTRPEAIVATMIHSISGLLPAGVGLLVARPFRAPHHTVSEAGLVGGGRIPRPGEVSLAHAGVLFLDELPEFRRNALEALRQPLEDGTVTVTRSMSTAVFPAEFLMVASMNPCPCGSLGHPGKTCRCTPTMVRNYLARVSGPLMDRMDLHVHVAPPTFDELVDDESAETSRDVRERVVRARGMQEKRAAVCRGVTNARVPMDALFDQVSLDGAAQGILRSAVTKLALSARAYHKILRIARTIADLDGSHQICTGHVCEAIQYRSLDKNA